MDKPSDSVDDFKFDIVSDEDVKFDFVSDEDFSHDSESDPDWSCDTSSKASRLKARRIVTHKEKQSQKLNHENNFTCNHDLKLTKANTPKRKVTGTMKNKGSSKKDENNSTMSGNDAPGVSRDRKNEAAVNLSLLVARERLESVKKVLDEFPEQFVTQYLKYLHELKHTGLSQAVRPKISKFHMLIASREAASTFNCVICKAEFLKSEQLLEHLKREHTGSHGLACICGKKYVNVKRFQKHSLKHLCQIFKCPYCDESFFRVSNLTKHFKLDHSLTSTGNFLCSMCQKTFRKQGEILEHINVHTGLSPYQCPQCGKSYRNLSTLRDHLECHKPDNCLEFECSVCNKVFARLQALKIHALTHAEERKFKCKICEKSFKRPQNLSDHVSSSHSTKTFSCDTCGSILKSKEGLRRHLKKHFTLENFKPSKKTRKSPCNRSANLTVKDSPSKVCASKRVVKKSLKLGKIVTDFEDDSNVEINKQPLYLDKTLSDFKAESDDDSL